MRKRTIRGKAAAVLTAVLVVGACGGSPQARSITLTFIRHAESEANASGTLDTSVPGPGLSQQGKTQAEEVAHQAGHNKFDGVYASTMVRTQQTAAPLAGELGKQVEVLQGIQEISAGWYQGKPVSIEPSTYLLAPADWIRGDMQDRIPGSVSGKEFNDEFTRAVRKVYDSGQSNPVVFSHKFAIEYWTLLNAKNAKDSLLTTHPLPNIGRVVLTGNPITGWTIVDWDGVRNFSG
ncbi:histidine phosphatase family protein [Mycobacterium shigaense]|uniref:Histidine phosphatase family protein n=1 Tax=Mycobacterium shigaense TaxID=722731 RepID=A0A1Z4EE13_9MYCO|nr:histidine phosphatase family protein [Mycobacterium shigaense]MEA1121790.1 histidine phosphatase family protein [Mycobacterium shigaense]PRI16038.1 histidine phosphatase family protein [Mycobacterium shigaense]BAX91216.1 histidine phosphatase family protein [Mycobacterium shigaense]